MGLVSLKTRMICAFILATTFLVTFFLTYTPNADRNSWSGLVWDGVLLALAVFCIVDLVRTMVRIVKRSRMPLPEENELHTTSRESAR